MPTPLGRGAWPPASPWVWSDTWWDAQQNPKVISLSWRFDSPVNGGGTNALQGLDYDVDPNCPWRWIILVKPDGTKITHQIPQGGRTGTITATQLAAIGLTTFADVSNSITVGATPN